MDNVEEKQEIKTQEETDDEGFLDFLNCFDGIPFTEAEAQLRYESRIDIQDAAIIGISNLYGINLERFNDMYAYVPEQNAFFPLDELVLWYESVRKPSISNLLRRQDINDELEDLLSSDDDSHKA